MNRPLFCLVVDDEPSARQVLERYIDDTSQLEHSASCSSALEAMEYLDNNQIDILFLDVNMPKLSGIEFLKSLQDPPAVILSTAYDDYALKGYELDVIDYLLKPYSYERFLKAILKTKKRFLTSPGDEKNSIITIRSNGKIYRIPLKEVLYFESLGDYVKVYLVSEELIFHDSLKRLEEELPEDRFTRVHKSYIVRIPSVDYLEGNMLKMGNHTIPIGNTYRDRVLSFFS